MFPYLLHGDGVSFIRNGLALPGVVAVAASLYLTLERRAGAWIYSFFLTGFAEI
ncbi:hypothetical protein VDG1235_4137 [Verrucomicrobiia bacterium DG1235]|nr:hypothetical protein VDG1235_4137 [Verrucomicrobiae bacterium DG1235]